MFPVPVDLVITWVRYDAFLKAQLVSFSSKNSMACSLLKGRFRDNGELYYSVLSYRTFMPWLRDIVIATNGQRPPENVLNIQGVRWVTHHEFFRDRNHLPTFNSNAIETNLCRIEGLAQHLIFANDDFFVGRPMNFEDFFHDLDTPTTYMEPSPVPTQVHPQDMHGMSLLATDALLSTRLGKGIRNQICHAPFPCLRSDALAAEADFSTELGQNSSCRFRSPKNIVYYFFMLYYRIWQRSGASDLIAGRSIPGMFRFPSAEDYCFVPVGDREKRWEERLGKILRKPPMFFCLNDHLGDSDEAGAQQKLLDFYKMLPLPH